MNPQDPKYQLKSKAVTSAEPNYFVHFAMRHPVAQLTNLTFSKGVQELEMASNQVSDQKENLKTFGKQGVLEKSELLEYNKTENTEENKSVTGNNSYKRKHYLQDYEIEATLEASKRQKTEKKIQELEMADNEVANQKEIIESFDKEEVLKKSETLEPLKCSKKRIAGEKKNIDKSKRKKSLQENENEFEESKRKRKYRCDICEKHYSKSSNLQRHIASVHEGLKPFSCPSCDYKCVSKTGLKTHIAGVHDGLKPFKCQTCDSNFASKGCLQKHISNVHDGEKPFKCELCEYTCAAKYTLDVHMKSTHGNNIITCSKCDREFTRKDFARPQLAKKKHEANCKGTQL